MSEPSEIKTNQIIPAGVRLLVLLVLGLWVFWPEIVNISLAVPKDSEKIHALIMPFAVLLMVCLRWSHLVKNFSHGSLWGIAFLLGGLLLYSASTWPFSFGYARQVAIIPVWAGAVLVTCGWRVLISSLPLLLLVLLSIPVGSRLYAGLIIRPETYTITAVSRALDHLPGIHTLIKGTDLFFTSERISGVIGLGESNRGAKLLLAYTLVGVFVVFSCIRSPGRIMFAMLTAGLIILFCNFLRLLSWALAVIYMGLGPESSLPRSMAAVCSLFICYGLFALACYIKLNLFLEDDQAQEKCKTSENHHAQN